MSIGDAEGELHGGIRESIRSSNFSDCCMDVK